ncbi:hypothetical protein OIU77_017298 [Salix suchowensis]|uniref:Aconitate hydratase n=1 Tax=Salix suchowensis TaxID=1278906 RepID=A0ABQ8ZNW4_9ROSI|nr:hypothetical protein OIU77_017298 [Salix suchowensis]
MNNLGGDSNKINPLVPVDLVIDHSVQVDVARSENEVQANMELEFQRNKERFAFLKWGSNAFQNMLVVPLGVVGTNSHTTMIDGLGVADWGVGGIEAEAAMLGQPMSMVLPGVHGVVGKFVEFYGEGMSELSLADRATIANMSTEYGATMGFFPVDHVTLQYLNLTGRSDETVSLIKSYLRANRMFVDYSEPQIERVYSSCLALNLEDVEPCISGPKRPHDQVPLREMKADWHACLVNRVGLKGFTIPKESQGKVAEFSFRGTPAQLRHSDVVIVAITSCINTSNPSVMLGAALVAKKACELELEVKPWIKTSLAPGSWVGTKYLEKSGLQKYLNQLGFHIVGYGCTTCIGNSGDIDEAVASAITENDLVVAAVLSGNRNFEGRVHPLTRANYLASPPLVVAYALAGIVGIDFETEPIGATYQAITKGNPMWNQLSVPSGNLDSTTTDHISPVGSIHKDSPAARYLMERGVDRRDFNSYGSKTLVVKAVIAKSFERIHRNNLVGMGIIPLRFKAGEDAETLGLTGHERYNIDLPSNVSEIRPGQDVTVATDNGKSFTCTLRFDTKVELEYFDHGGILQYVIRNLIHANH